jgi:hypothetical protein
MDVEDTSENKQKMNEECQQRYVRLHSIVEEIDAFPLSRTADWYTEHYKLLSTYDEHFFTGFAIVNPEIIDIKFRKDCQFANALMTILMNQYRVRGWFSLYDYQRLNKILIQLTDTVAREPDMDVDLDFGKLHV